MGTRLLNDMPTDRFIEERRNERSTLSEPESWGGPYHPTESRSHNLPPLSATNEEEQNDLDYFYYDANENGSTENGSDEFRDRVRIHKAMAHVELLTRFARKRNAREDQESSTNHKPLQASRKLQSPLPPPKLRPPQQAHAQTMFRVKVPQRSRAAKAAAATVALRQKKLRLQHFKLQRQHSTFLDRNTSFSSSHEQKGEWRRQDVVIVNPACESAHTSASPSPWKPREPKVVEYSPYNKQDPLNDTRFSTSSSDDGEDHDDSDGDASQTAVMSEESGTTCYPNQNHHPYYKDATADKAFRPETSGCFASTGTNSTIGKTCDLSQDSDIVNNDDEQSVAQLLQECHDCALQYYTRAQYLKSLVEGDQKRAAHLYIRGRNKRQALQLWQQTHIWRLRAQAQRRVLDQLYNLMEDLYQETRLQPQQPQSFMHDYRKRFHTVLASLYDGTLQRQEREMLASWDENKAWEDLHNFALPPERTV